MKKLPQKEKVYFFESQSQFNSQYSFGSDSIKQSSQYYDFTNQLIAETDKIFLTLRQELQATQTKSIKDKIQYILRRVIILQRDTIPEHIGYLNKIEAPPKAMQQVSSCGEQLSKLLTDYQRMRNGTMIYRQFHNIYGKQKDSAPKASTFSSKKSLLEMSKSQPIIKPSVIEINHIHQSKLKAATPRLFTANSPNKDKQLNALRQQVNALKYIIDENRRKYQLQSANQKIICQKRIRSYLRQEISDETSTKLRNQLIQMSEKLSNSLQENVNIKQIVQDLNKQLLFLQSENQTLKEQIQSLKKRITPSQLQRNKSFLSQSSQVQDRKVDKISINLKQQIQLLRNQLKTERQRLYRLQSFLTQQQRRELSRGRRNLQKRMTQLKELYSNLDKQRIQMAQLIYKNKSNLKLLQTFQSENEDLKAIIKRNNFNDQTTPTILSFQNDKTLTQSNKTSKTQIQKYQGERIEGYPYYDLLSKQFKIRFRRACLRQKQLLYKQNGVQIGVISNFQPSNRISMIIHLTNYSQTKFENIKVRIMNSNLNKVAGSTFNCPNLTPNQQVKVQTSLLVNQYPIGPLVFLLEYTSEKKKEEVRILLPAHIFKMMRIQERSEDIEGEISRKIDLVSQRKICKNMNEMRSLLKVGQKNNEKIKVSVYNEHTNTLMYLDIVQNEIQFMIEYQHKEGVVEITQYFIKTLILLIQKEEIS